MSWIEEMLRRQRARGPAGGADGHPADPEGASPLYARDLCDEYDGNAVAADERYRDAVLDVVGRIGAVERDRRGRITVFVSTGRFLTGIRCRFRGDRLPDVLPLRKGCVAWVHGRCAGLDNGYAVLEDCALRQHAGPSVQPPEMATAYPLTCRVPPPPSCRPSAGGGPAPPGEPPCCSGHPGGGMGLPWGVGHGKGTCATSKRSAS